jgi:WD40 repeat protein
VEPLVLAGHEGPVNQAVWNADGSRILTASGDGTARVWDAATGAELFVLSGHENVIHQAVWNADGGRILTASGDGTARVWDAGTGAELLVLSGDWRAVYQAVWNADGSRILTAGCDRIDTSHICAVGTARVWDAGTGAELLVLSGDWRVVYQAVWNADGSRILTASSDGTARLWYSRMEDLIEAACRIAPRNLTRVEWEQYMKGEDYRATCENLPLED